jgi:hypothetical protein
MEFLGGEEACPQREEGFVRCDWVSVAEALDRIKYKETREVVRKAEAVLAAAAAPEPAEPSEVQHGPPPP